MALASPPSWPAWLQPQPIQETRNLDEPNRSLFERNVSTFSPTGDSLESSRQYQEKILKQPKRTFHSWMKSLQSRQVKFKKTQKSSHSRSSQDPNSHEETTRLRLSRRSPKIDRRSRSSFQFVTGVQSASVSTCTSAMTKHRRIQTLSNRLSKTEHSSWASFSRPRTSEESTQSEDKTFSPALLHRALQRRHVLEELLETEENYIGDVRFLLKIYTSILAHHTCLGSRLKQSVCSNLNDMICLHDNLLGDLHRVIPDSEYSQLDFVLPLLESKGTRTGHKPNPDPDAIRKCRSDISQLKKIPGLLSEPQVAGEVAKIFTKNEYGAKYEAMIKNDIDDHEGLPELGLHQKALEFLQFATRSSRSDEGEGRKSSLVPDLFVKPIQRMCRYPLLLAELIRLTPATECPQSHMEIETALNRLREATVEINRATGDCSMKPRLEKTWLLQDRLVLPGQKIDSETRTKIRSLGHIRMCGALYVCWQTSDRIKGKYMMCLLYREILCLATAAMVDPIYSIYASINLNTAWIEEVNTSRGGLQCHTAPFSWKLVFENDDQLYELIMSACSAEEENQWREQLRRPFPFRSPTPGPDPNLFTCLLLNIRSLGPVVGRPGTVVRQKSIHRAMTVGSASNSCQVIIRNTSSQGTRNTSLSTVNRSHSLQSTNARFPVLVPSRGERARLQLLMSDIWSKDLLPFPGMLSRSRSERSVRDSASNAMRKFSSAGHPLVRRHSMPGRIGSSRVAQTSDELNETNKSTRPSDDAAQKATTEPRKGETQTSTTSDEEISRVALSDKTASATNVASERGTPAVGDTVSPPDKENETTTSQQESNVTRSNSLRWARFGSLRESDGSGIRGLLR